MEMKLNVPAYSIEQIVEETKATMAMEGMKLTEEEIQMLRDYTEGSWSVYRMRGHRFPVIIGPIHYNAACP